jgi:hypothetical protein
MENFFEIISSIGLNRKDVSPISRLPKKNLRMICELGYGLLPEYYRDNHSLAKYRFVANRNLSGGGDYCSEIGCRMKEANLIATNTALYADTVFIGNPFEKWVNKKILDSDRFELATDLAILLKLQPLIESGLIRVTKSENHFCSDCYNNFVKKFDPNFDQQLQITLKNLTQTILEKVDFTVVNKKQSTYVSITGVKNLLIDHEMVIVFKKVPLEIKKLVKGKSKVKLSKREVQEFGLIASLINPIYRDLSFQDYFTKLYDANFLTNRQVDYDILIRSNSNPNYNLNKVIGNLNHVVPHLQDIPIEKIISLRDNEGESFVKYRTSLFTAIEQSKSLTEKQVQELFKETIRPEVLSITKTIKKNKKHLLTKASQNLVIGSAFIGMGLYSGLLPARFNEIVGFLGGLQFFNEMKEDVIKLFQTPDEVKSNPYYFLWRLNKESIR